MGNLRFAGNGIGIGRRAALTATSAMLAFGLSLPAPAMAQATEAGAGEPVMAAQELPDISMAEVSRPLVWAGSSSVGFTVSMAGEGLAGGFTVEYLESDENGLALGPAAGPFEAGAFYLAHMVGDGDSCTGERFEWFQALEQVDLADNWSIEGDAACVYTGEPVKPSVRYTDATGCQAQVPEGYLRIVFYDDDGNALPEGEAPSGLGYHGYVIEGDGVHFTGAFGTPDSPNSLFIYEPLDFSGCSLGQIPDAAYTGYAIYPDFGVTYPDGYASAGQEVDTALYDVKFYGEGGYLGDFESPVEVGDYTVVVEGKAEYGCTGSCEGAFKVTDDKPMLPVMLFDASGNPSYADMSFVEDGSNPTLDIHVGSFGDDGAWTELDGGFYDIDVMSADGGVVVTDYSAPGFYKIRATGKNGYVGATYCFFRVTERPATPEGPEPSNPGSTQPPAKPAAPSQPSSGKPAAAVKKTAMHRLYNPWSGEHFYTGDASEKNHLVSLGWTYEGVGWNAPASGTDVHRLYNPYTGEHHFTPDAAEKNACVAAGWRYEGVGWKSGGSVKVYREYNPYAPAFYHNYTRDAKEHSYLCSIGWVDEGTGWYGA